MIICDSQHRSQTSELCKSGGGRRRRRRRERESSALSLPDWHQQDWPDWLRVFTVWSALVGLGRARQEKYNYSLIDIKYDGLSRVGRGPLRTGGRHC